MSRLCCHALLCSPDFAVTSVNHIFACTASPVPLCQQHTCLTSEQPSHHLSDAWEDGERLRGDKEALLAEREKVREELLHLQEQRREVVAERDGLAAQQAQAIKGDTATAREDAITD